MTTAAEIDPKKVNGRIVIIHCLNSSGFTERTDSIVPEDEIHWVKNAFEYIAIL